MADRFDLVVIGAGPGGYVAALRAVQLGMKVAVVEKDASLGGTCLNVGCIPSKALLESSARYAEAKEHLAEHGVRVSGVALDLSAMMARKDAIVRRLTGGVGFLFKRAGIERVLGLGRLAGGGKVEVLGLEPRTLEAERILIATGSAPASLPGVHVDGARIVTSTEALSFTEVPRRLVVIGAGVIGLELGSVWRRLGAEVTVLEYLPRILPEMDGELAAAAQKALEKQGLVFALGARVLGARVADAEAVVAYQDANGAEREITAERVLVAVGRRPYTEGLGVENAGVALDGRGRVVVDAHYQTSAPGVYAIGDVIGGPMLAHKASEEGIAVVEWMATGRGHPSYTVVPAVVYTHPEVASVGKTEEQLQRESVEYRKGAFPFRANGRALSMGAPDGFVKILADKKTDRILGAHILAPAAGELIQEIALAMEFLASSEDVARSTHAHPTLAEAVKEAALAVEGRALHV